MEKKLWIAIVLGFLLIGSVALYDLAEERYDEKNKYTDVHDENSKAEMFKDYLVYIGAVHDIQKHELTEEAFNLKVKYFYNKA